MKIKQSKANEANVSFCSRNCMQGIQKSLHARFSWGGGSAQEENGLFQKRSRHLILPKSKRGKATNSPGKARQGFITLSARTVWLR